MNMPVVPTPATEQSWWQSLQVNIEYVLRKLNLNSHDVVHILSFLCVGFLTGFLLKKYFKYFFIVTLLIVVVLLLLDRFGVILINWDNMQHVTGVDPQSTIQQCLEAFFNLIRDNLAVTVSVIVGVMLGYRIG
jgi:uncharacterized membrane protein (Fun14 family)